MRDPLIVPVRKPAFEVRLHLHGAALYVPRTIHLLRPKKEQGATLQGAVASGHADFP
jgi:predicted transcriptional regulator of viral defense system